MEGAKAPSFYLLKLDIEHLRIGIDAMRYVCYTMYRG